MGRRAPGGGSAWVMASRRSPGDSAAIPDHFDGRRFRNPTLRHPFAPGFRDVLRMLRERRAAWPAAVANVGVPRLHEPRGPDDIGLTFVGHATFVIQLPRLTILTDPMWSERASPVRWWGPKRVRPPGVPLADLPDIDVIVLSHNHYDHLDIATLQALQRRFSPTVLVPRGVRPLVASIGFDDVRELDWWDAAQVGSDVHVTFTPAQHASGRSPFDRNRSLWGGYYIRQHGRSVYFGGDGGYSTHFADIGRRLGAPDIAMLGIGSYEPRWFMQPVHMNPAEAVAAHKDLGADVSIGMHFGTFQLSAEALDQPRWDLAEAIANEGGPSDDFVVLHEGETRIFPSRRSDGAAPGAR